MVFLVVSQGRRGWQEGTQRLERKRVGVQFHLLWKSQRKSSLDTTNVVSTEALGCMLRLSCTVSWKSWSLCSGSYTIPRKSWANCRSTRKGYLNGLRQDRN